MSKKRIILVGCAASGKDYARKICEQWLDMPYQVSYTTRPPREEEQHGLDYFFVTEEQFLEKVDADEWYEFVVFNGWYYGTTREQFYTQGAVFIMTPSGLAHLSETDRAESLVVYFDIPEEIRETRMQYRRGNADSIQRRLVADRADFNSFTNYDVKVTDPGFNIGDIAEIAQAHLSIKPVKKVQN